jgi:hypothetical protein
MIRRCTKPECPSYDDYGGRGITVCTQWLSFENFFADMGDRPDGMSLERKEVNGNYEPSNCVWIPMVHQVYNRRVTIRVEIEGCSMALSQACSVLGVDYTRTHSRMRRLGWSFQKAIAEPKKLNGTSYAPMTKPAI